MPTDDAKPGEWIDISLPGTYRRLRQLASRRLGGNHHHADDVVARALIRWVMMPKDTTHKARIEQVIISEAYSLLRSEARIRGRERRAGTDPTRAMASWTAPETDVPILRHSLSEALEQQESEFENDDLEVLEFLYTGYSIAEICRATDFSRYYVARSRAKWQRLLRGVHILP